MCYVKSKCCALGEKAIGTKIPTGGSSAARPTNEQLDRVRSGSVPPFCSINRTPLPAGQEVPFYPCPIAPAVPLPFRTGALIGMFFGDTRVRMFLLSLISSLCALSQSFYAFFIGRVELRYHH
jgi:hypothetical protein